MRKYLIAITAWIILSTWFSICGIVYAEKIQNGQVIETEITFTVQEAQAAIGLFDLATKSGGLQVAEAAIVLTKKFQQAFKMKPKVEAKDEKK